MNPAPCQGHGQGGRTALVGFLGEKGNGVKLRPRGRVGRRRVAKAFGFGGVDVDECERGEIEFDQPLHRE